MAIRLDQLGFERNEKGDNKHYNTRPGIPAEEKCTMGGPPTI